MKSRIYLNKFFNHVNKKMYEIRLYAENWKLSSDFYNVYLKNRP